MYSLQLLHLLVDFFGSLINCGVFLVVCCVFSILRSDKY